MTHYIAFLRGINVGGHRAPMAQLRELFEGLGLNGVGSYINSGNLFFDTDNSNRQQLTKIIEQRLYEVFGYEVPTFLRTVAEVESILELNPFRDIELTDDKRFCVMFTNEPIDMNILLPFQSSKNDMDLVGVNPYEAFVVWRIINGRPPSGQFPSEIIPRKNTSRFYHTLVKILKAAKA